MIAAGGRHRNRRCRQRQPRQSTWPWIPPTMIRSPRSPRAAPATAARRSSRICLRRASRSSLPALARARAALNLQGTSMASPHTAGAAALLRQAHPKLDQAAIKALLQNSTVDANVSGDTDLMRQGVGSLRVDRAVDLTSYAAPAGVSFGRLNPLTPTHQNERVTVTDLSGKKRSFKVTHVPHTAYPGRQRELPEERQRQRQGQGQVRHLAEVRSARCVGRRRVRRCVRQPDGSRRLVHAQRRQGHAARRLRRRSRSGVERCRAAGPRVQQRQSAQLRSVARLGRGLHARQARR